VPRYFGSGLKWLSLIGLAALGRPEPPKPFMHGHIEPSTITQLLPSGFPFHHQPHITSPDEH
jgi:hypothetical protein